MAARLPRLSPAALPAAHECRRRFALTLTSSQRQRSDADNTRRRFALLDAVVTAARRAHAQASAEVSPPSDALAVERPPHRLEPEERTAFSEALQRYAGVADTRGGTVPARPPDEFVQARSSTERFEISIKIDLALDTGDALEVRRLAFAPPRVDDLAEDPRARLTALALRPDPPVRYVHVDLSTGDTDEIEVDASTRNQWGAELQRVVIEALDEGDPPATPGMWCSSCEVVAGCPSIPEALLDELAPSVATRGAGEDDGGAGTGGGGPR